MEVKLSLNQTWFDATNSNGVTIKLGSGLEDGPSPVEVVLMAAGACTGIDVVSTLKKMRQPLEDLDITVLGQRRDEHPRYFESIIVKYVLKGNLEPDKVNRAIELSLKNYCSVTSGLEPKAKVSYEFIIEQGSDAS